MEDLIPGPGASTRLPVAPTGNPPAGEEQRHDSTSGSAARGFAPGQRPSLLIVDDQALNRKVLQRQLQMLGLDCVEAASGQEALDQVAVTHFDIIITDCFMPSMDGLELARRLRSLEAAGRPRATIIALTANAVKGVAERCYEAGADDYLTKPLGLAELSNTLHRWHYVGAENSGRATARPALKSDPSNLAPAPIDKDVLASILGDDDPSVLKQTTQVFLAAWRKSLSSLHQQLHTRNAKELAEAVHAAKGVAHYGAAPRLIDNCARLECLAQNHQWPQAASVFENLKRETQRIQDHLDGWR